MSQIIAPKHVVFASAPRRESAHGGLVSTLVGMLPFLGSKTDCRNYHAFDVVVTSSNPLLAALVLRRAATTGATAAVVMSEQSDPWPYDLADTEEVAALVASAAGLPVEAHPTGGSPTTWLLERMLAGLPRSFPVVEGQLAPGSRHPDGELALYMVGKPVSPLDRFSSDEQASMQDVFLRFMQGRPSAKTGSRGFTVVFAREIVLTGRPRSFGRSNVADGRISWGNERIRGLGTARWDVPDYGAAAKLMVEDIVTAGRWSVSE